MPDRKQADGDARLGRESLWAVWAVAAAFGTYFCMYGFRKPFTAASYSGADVFGVDFKTAVVSSQVLGYMLSKFIGIKVVSEMPPPRRAIAILVLIGCAEVALVLFGAVPRPWNVAFLFFNGLSLGMVFGLVLSFLEGRQLTEALAAGLCASFILADGVTKTVGAWLLNRGIPEDWMPSVAGLIFVAPLCAAVAVLARTPRPSPRDIEARAVRDTLNRAQRWALYRRYAIGLTALMVMYLTLTVIRSLRADFAPELWRGLGEPAAPSTFTRSEAIVALGIMAINGLAIYIRNNRIAFFVSLAACGFGFALTATALLARQASTISAFPFMVLIGFGLYLPYVAMHTTVFERLLAMTRERGNLAFLLYVADAFGYLGYVAVMFYGNFMTPKGDFLPYFTKLCWLAMAISVACILVCWRYFAVQHPREPVPAAAEGTA